VLEPVVLLLRLRLLVVMQRQRLLRRRRRKRRRRSLTTTWALVCSTKRVTSAAKEVNGWRARRTLERLAMLQPRLLLQIEYILHCMMSKT